MNRKIVLALLCALVASVVASDVLELNPDTFDEAIASNELIMVEFYAPWCGHCKKLEPEYEKAATDLKGKVALAKVDADKEVNGALRNRFGIRGFPTIKVFRNGKVTDYEGGRTAEAITSFLLKQTLPSVSNLNSVEEVNTFSSQARVVIIGIFADRESAEFKQFNDYAEAWRNKFLFGAVVGNSAVNTEFGVTAPSVILFKKFDEGKNVLPADQFADLEAFVTKSSVPLIDEIGQHNYKIYMESGLPLAYLFVDLQVEGQLNENIQKIRSVAESNKGKLNWVYIDWSKFARHSERLGLSGKTVPALAIEVPSTGKHFAFDETADITTEAVTAWAASFLSGELQPTIKSEPIPASQDGPVTILVAKNFDQIVLDSTKDVFVEFYAPWCGHCKKLAPIFDELGTMLKSVSSVVIAKIDATANDISSEYHVQGFPTLLFFPANNKKPVDYEGDRSLEDMLNFIKEQASTKFELPQSKDEL